MFSAEIHISTTEATSASARASMQRCLAYPTANKWFDVAIGNKHADVNVTTSGPGGPS